MKMVTWNEYTKMLEKLHQQVQLTNFDNIVGVGRGGSIIAAYLASKLGIPRFYSIFMRHVGRGTEMKIVVHDTSQVKNIKGKILVVDDWVCEGRAMKFVLDLLPKKSSIATMAMFQRKGAEFKPDFVGAEVDAEERDIMFPYDL